MSLSRLFSWRLLPFLFASALLVLAALVSATTESVSIARLSRDTVASAGLPPHTGALSTLGLLLWGAAATVCFFSARLIARRKGTPSTVRFLIASGALTTLLLLDDAFLLHENAGRIGLSSNAVVLAYAIATVGLFWVFRKEVLSGEPELLVLAGALFALAVGADVLHDYEWLKIPGPDATAIALLIEDGFKFLGIVGWLNYYVWACLGYLRPRHAPGRA